MEDQNLLMWIAGQLIVAAAIWGGIRTDIRGIHSRMDHIEKSARDAHARLDNHLERRSVER